MKSREQILEMQSNIHNNMWETANRIGDIPDQLAIPKNLLDEMNNLTIQYELITEILDG